MSRSIKFNPNDFEPRRFALKYNPPQIIMEYKVPSTNKLYHHKIKLPKLKKDSNIEDVIKEVYEKHKIYLDSNKINEDQIINLIDKLKLNLKTNIEGKELDKLEEEDIEELLNEDESNDGNYDFSKNQYLNIKKDIDLNNKSLDIINKAKVEMKKDFLKNAVDKNSSDYNNDVRLNYNNNNITKKDNDWGDSYDESKTIDSGF